MQGNGFVDGFFGVHAGGLYVPSPLLLLSTDFVQAIIQ